MVDCLRGKSIDELLSVSLVAPDHLTAFGPIIDGIVVPQEPRIMLANIKTSAQQSFKNFQVSSLSESHLARHTHGVVSSFGGSFELPINTGNNNHHHQQQQPDLMVGVTRVEVPPVFNSHEERHGINMARRDRMLRTLVRNSYDYHQQVSKLMRSTFSSTSPKVMK